MSLLGELKAVDVSGIVGARGSLTASIHAPDLQALLAGGASSAALGELGAALDAIRGGDPGALLRPMGKAFGDAHALFHTGDLPIDQLAGAIVEGAGLLAKLLAGLDGDFATVGAAFGPSLGGLFEQLHGRVGGMFGTALGGVTGLMSLVEQVDGGAPGDATALAELAIDALMPLPRDLLETLRGHCDRLAQGAAAIAISPRRTAGLIDAFARVETAANARDAAALRLALSALDQVRLSTSSALRDELVQALGQIRALDIAAVFAPVERADQALRGITDGLLEALARWREQIAMLRSLIEQLDPAQLTALLPRGVAAVEDFIQRQLLGVLDAQVQRAVDWLRGLLRHLPLAHYRAELTAFFHGIVSAIDHADLGRYARDAHALLDKIGSLASVATLSQAVQQAIAAIGAAIERALQGVFDALAAIKTAVEAVAGDAEQVIGRALPALTQFNAAIQQVQDGVEHLDIAAAGEQVIAQLEKLRVAAEKLLTVAPLPEPLRPQIDQLVAMVRAVNLDEVFAPMRAAAQQLHLPDELAHQVDDGLKAAAGVIDNLIPARLIASLDDEVKGVLAQIAAFDPLKLLPDLTGYLQQAGDAVEKLAPSDELAAELHAPFQQLLDLVDSVQPMKLLAPAIAAYDKLLSSLPLPEPRAAVQKATDAVHAIGNQAAAAVSAPLNQVAAGGGTSPGPTAGAASSPSGAAPSAPAPGPAPAPPTDVRPGDVVRLFGFLPGKLCEALRAMEAGPAGDVLRAIDRVCGGLARDLRALHAALWQIDAQITGGIDRVLGPLAEHQVRAQLAIRANFDAGQLDVTAAMAAVALAGPGELRIALTTATHAARASAHELAAGLARNIGPQLERAASALERSLLGRVTGDLDALLAALDPEPIAAEMDALVGVILARAPALFSAVADSVAEALARLQELITGFHPMQLAQRFLVVLDVVKEMLDLLSPRRLAVELGEVHGAIRDVIAAYDPGVFVTAFRATVKGIADALRKLDPTALAGDTTLLKGVVADLEAALPSRALVGVGADLDKFAEQLAAVDLASLTRSVEGLGPRVVDELETVADKLKQEIVAVLESLRYASGSASATVTVST